MSFIIGFMDFLSLLNVRVVVDLPREGKLLIRHDCIAILLPKSNRRSFDFATLRSG
jgi:hypothetical protein